MSASMPPASGVSVLQVPLVDVDHGSAVLAASWIAFVAAAGFVALRLYSRLLTRSSGYDDAIIGLALIGSLIGSIFNCLQVHNGFGRHGVFLSEYQREQAYRWTFAAKYNNGMTTGLIKISICWFVIRILKDGKRSLRIFMGGVLGFVLTITIIFALIVGLSCMPLNAVWDKSIDGNCISHSTIDHVRMAADIIDIVVNFFCASLPILALESAPTDRRIQAFLAVLLTISFMAAACSVGRVVTVNFANVDTTWDPVEASIWSILEVNLAIIAASIPIVCMLPWFSPRTPPNQPERNKHRTESSDSSMEVPHYANAMSFCRSKRNSTSSADADEIQLMPGIVANTIVKQMEVETFKCARGLNDRDMYFLGQNLAEPLRNPWYVDPASPGPARVHGYTPSPP